MKGESYLLHLVLAEVSNLGGVLVWTRVRSRIIHASREADVIPAIVIILRCGERIRQRGYIMKRTITLRSGYKGGSHLVLSSIAHRNDSHIDFARLGGLLLLGGGGL